MPVYLNPQSSFFDKSFNTSSPDSCTLIIQIGHHGADIAVYEDVNNKFIALESFKFTDLKSESQITDKIDQLVSKRSWLTKKFKQVRIIYSNPVVSLIPQALFSKNEADLYLNFNHPVNENFSTCFNQLKTTGAAGIFSYPKSLEEKLKTVWPDSSLHHSSNVFIESLLINYKNKPTEKTVFILVTASYIDVVHIRNGKLFFHNVFQYKSKEDFIYFTLAAIEQLELNPEDIKTILAGSIDKSSVYYDMLYRYLKEIEFIPKNDLFKYTYLLDNINLHQYYLLFNLLQCE